jgi:hypothetical protein
VAVAVAAVVAVVEDEDCVQWRWMMTMAFNGGGSVQWRWR